MWTRPGALRIPTPDPFLASQGPQPQKRIAELFLFLVSAPSWPLRLGSVTEGIGSVSCNAPWALPCWGTARLGGTYLLSSCALLFSAGQGVFKQKSGEHRPCCVG